MEGDFDSVVTTLPRAPSIAPAVATLRLALNSSVDTTFPPLGITVVVDASTENRSHPIPPNGSILMTINTTKLVEFDVRAAGPGEYTVVVSPDAASSTRGWCGELRRQLRLQPPALVPPGGPGMVRVLQTLQPVSFVNDFFISSRNGTVRRVVPPMQVRVGNDSWLSQRLHPWQKVRK